MSVEEEEMVVEEEEEEEVAEAEADAEGDAPADQDVGAEEEGSGEAIAGAYNAKEVNDQIFEELRLAATAVEEVKATWAAFLHSADSREAAGEAIYAALFDSAPSLQSLFKTPRAVMAMRFMNGLNQIISSLHDPKGLKIIVETLGFQHLDLEVTVPRVVIFRDAIIDLLQVEMGGRFNMRAREGWATFLNYVGGSYIYVRVKYAERLRTLGTSWAQANNKDLKELEIMGEEGKEEGAEGEEGEGTGEGQEAGAIGNNADFKAQGVADEKKNATKKGSNTWFGMRKKAGGASDESRKEGDSSTNEDGTKDFRNTNVPKTFEDMFMFNAAVMGFGGHTWMNEVLASFDTIVTNVANSYRLQEECDILSLRMAKYKGIMNLGEYKAVMLASLRSLVKDWGSLHEVSWSWLWENVERMIKALMGKPAVQEAALASLFGSMDEKAQNIIRREVYTKFFALAPAGQDYFKQSTTRLFFIADKLVTMTLDIYKDPKRMVEDISALGLRHVGYGIPTDLFGPFVTACVQVIRTLTEDDKAEEAFRWSLSLISRILTRVINEGSTIVMKAINTNSKTQLRKAIGCAPRGKRALWMLNIQVGTQSISPLIWAIETGSLEAARGIIQDLLTIRADRDRYYFGMDIMFERHPDIIKRLCVDAPALLTTLLDGLIWRSRTTENGLRRVNYYIKHILVDSEGDFSKATEWVTDNGDPKLVCHPIMVMVTDTVWSRIAFRTFMFLKLWFLFTLVVFVMSQSILNHLSAHASAALSTGASASGASASGASASGASASGASASGRRLAGGGGDGDDYQDNSFEVRLAIFACRVFIYFCSLGQCLVYHIKWMLRDIRHKDFAKVGQVHVPAYLMNWQDVASLGLTMFLVAMLCMEPILHCIQEATGDHLFTEHCPAGEALLFGYSIMSTAAMLLYFLLLTDLSVFSTRVSAFALVCGRVLSELVLFLFGLSFFVAAFACAVSALEQDDPDFAGIPRSGLQLYKMVFGMFSGTHYDMLMDYPALMFAIFVYVITTIIFMLNLLIAQLNCSYQATYQDMLGYARLNRGKIVAETMPSVPRQRWERFTGQLKLDDRVEFGEGDIGLAGGVQVFETASANITTVDMIRRFGGSTSQMAQWPEEEGNQDSEEDRFDRMEKLIEKAMKRLVPTKGGRKKGGGSSTGQGSSDQVAEDTGEHDDSTGSQG